VNQMLLSHEPTEPLPQFFQTFFQPIVQPALWEFRGNTPALVSMIKSYISRGTEFISQEPNLRAVLGVYSTLINSKLNDQFGFEIIESIFQFIPGKCIEPFAQPAFLRILMRLKSSPTNKFMNGLIKFLAYTMLIEKTDYNPEYILQIFNQIDSGVVLKLSSDFITPNLNKVVSPFDRTLVGIGISVFLRHTIVFLNPETGSTWLSLLDQLISFLAKPQISMNGNKDLDSFDVEDAHFSAPFVKLVTSTVDKPNIALKHGPPEVFLVNTVNQIDLLLSGQLKSSFHLLSQESQENFQRFVSLTTQ